MGTPAKLNDPLIPFGTPNLGDLLYGANPSTGKGFKFPATDLLGLITGTKPATTFATIASLLANTTIGLGYFAFVADASSDPVAISGWAIYLYNGPTRTSLANYTLIATQRNKHARGQWSLGIYNEEYPNTTDNAVGSGPAGVIQEGDYWYIPVGGEGNLDVYGLGVTPLSAGAILKYLGGTLTAPVSWKVIM